MRGGLRLPAVVVVIGLLAGCSDPAGAVRKERAAARKSSPTPAVTPKKAAAKTWWQAPGRVKTAGGLRVHTGTLHPDLLRVAITDVSSHATRTITASSHSHGAVIGHFTLTGVKLAKSPKTGAYGVTFRYHRG